MGIFPDAQGQLTPQSMSDLAEFQTCLICYDFLITCNNEEDPIKNEGTRVVTRFSPL